MRLNKKQIAALAPLHAKSSVISPCENYRYRLERAWDHELPKVAFLMLNPSTADASNDDPTIRRCISFAKSWGYGGIIVGNLFAIRSADPIILKLTSAPVGPDNDKHLLDIAHEVDEIVCAWGANGSLYKRDEAVCNMLLSSNLVSIKRTKDGSPGHPLCVKSTAQRTPFFGKDHP